jgi:hypothetical protein
MTYHFNSSINEIGNLASGIYLYDFDESSDSVSSDYISGWLQNNIGELNTLIHSCYSGADPKLGDQEQSIYRQLFLKDYYFKLGRKTLLGVGTSSLTVGAGELLTSDWVELRDGDSMIRRKAVLSSPSEKITASKQYTSFAQEAESALRVLLYKYNVTKGGPRQVAGKDSEA